MKNKVLKRKVKKYIRHIKSAFPIMKTQEKTFIKALTDDIEGFIEENPQCTIEDVIDRFGEPKNIAEDYLVQLDTSRLSDELMTSCATKQLLKVILTIAIFLGIISTILVYIGYQKSLEKITETPEIEIYYKN